MAYAAVISLKHTIHRTKNPQITKSAYEELNSLVYLLKRVDGESSRGIDRSVINELDAKIRDAVWKVEDVLESYQGFEEKGVEQEIDLFLKSVNKLGEEYYRELQNPIIPQEEDDYAAVVPPIHEHESTTVGLSDLSEEIISEFVDGKLGRRKSVALVGMAGIGKTHLARQIYQHPRIVQHFDSRAWVSVGPKPGKMNDIYADVLAQTEGKPRDLFKDKRWDVIRDLLRSCLGGRRYLIVLDDVWNTQVLLCCKQFLTSDKAGSRLLLTTRLQEVAQYQTTKIHQMPFLNNEESWNLLWQNVFGTEEDSFPSELEKPGRKIADKCEGLPLLILAVANILRGLDKTEEYWVMVAEKKTTTFTDAYDQIYEVLLSSYEYLPQHLKPCFLYMGVFPQSYEIPLSKLIDLWTIEDFLEPTPSQKLDDFAEECMKGLVSNSLAIVCKQSFERVRRIKSSKLHSAYWYVCVTEARKNNFFHVLIKLTDVFSIERPRRLSVQNNILLGLKEVYDSMGAATYSTTRSLLCTGEDHQYPVGICLNMMLLMRVLDALTIRFYEFPEEVVKLLKLRYLSLTHNGELPSSINNLQKLECLILRGHHNVIKFPTTCLPVEIWNLQELRHLQVTGRKLRGPISKGAKLPKLSKLYVNADSCSEDVFKSIPNLKKLAIEIELHPTAAAAAETLRWLEHIGVLNKLETLKCEVVNPRLMSELVVDHLSNLPESLKKLSLKGLGYPWKYMTAIASLPNLKVLKLRCSAFRGPEWVTKAEQFKSLEFLLLEDLDVVHWINHKSFRCLHHLIVRHCYKLKKMPRYIGGIATLETMVIDDCSPSVVGSAQLIKEKTIAYDLQLVINSSWKL